jgi:toxin ParE1/3/4
MKVAFDPEAIDDLEGIYKWIAQDSPTAAGVVIERLLDSIEHLESFPNMGRAGRDEGTRECRSLAYHTSSSTKSTPSATSLSFSPSFTVHKTVTEYASYAAAAVGALSEAKPLPSAARRASSGAGSSVLSPERCA